MSKNARDFPRIDLSDQGLEGYDVMSDPTRLSVTSLEGDLLYNANWPSRASDRVRWLSEQDNLAVFIENHKRLTMGEYMIRMYQHDDGGLNEWKAEARAGLDAASLKDKSQAKLPVVHEACVQFSAKAIPTIIDSPHIIKANPGSEGGASESTYVAERIGHFMSYLLMEQDQNWQRDTDIILQHAAATGMAFRKHFFDSHKGRMVSKFIAGTNLVLSNDVDNIKDAPRLTEEFTLFPIEIRKLMRKGQFVQFDLVSGSSSQDDQQAVQFLEQHFWFDVDGDGVEEPYVGTIHKQTGQLVRLTPAFVPQMAQYSPNGHLIEIERLHYYNPYVFMHDVEGKFYGYGYGKSVATLGEEMNKLLDDLLKGADNMNKDTFICNGNGIRAKNIEIKKGTINILPSSTADLKSTLMEIPKQEPPAVLFSLLEMLKETSREVSSLTDMLVGQGAANMPASTALALIEQGMQVYSAVHKRMHRAITNEAKNVYTWLSRFMGNINFTYEGTSYSLSGSELATETDVRLTSDPSMTTNIQRMAMTNMVVQMHGMGADPAECIKRMATLARLPDPESLVPQQPGPDPKVELEQAKFDFEKQKWEDATAVDLREGENDLVAAKVDLTEAQAVSQYSAVEVNSTKAKRELQESKRNEERIDEDRVHTGGDAGGGRVTSAAYGEERISGKTSSQYRNAGLVTPPARDIGGANKNIAARQQGNA